MKIFSQKLFFLTSQFMINPCGPGTILVPVCLFQGFSYHLVEIGYISIRFNESSKGLLGLLRDMTHWNKPITKGRLKKVFDVQDD